MLAACACVWLRAGEKPAPRPIPNDGAELVDPPSNTAPRGGIAEVLDPNEDAPQDPELPRVEISGDGETVLGCWLALDGSPSTDPLHGQLEYAWTQVGGKPLPLQAEELKNARLWLYLAYPDEYRFVLRVKNRKGWSRPAERYFKVPPSRPLVPESEARQMLGAGELLALPGEGWKQVWGPKLKTRYENGVLSGRPIHPGLYLFEAPRAGDAPERRGAVVPPGREHDIGDRRPIAKAPRNLVGQTGRPLLINATLSYDPDGIEETRELEARWTLAERYRGVRLERLPNLRVNFTAAKPGVYTVLLVVSDGRLESDPPEPILIQIEPSAPAELYDSAYLAIADFDSSDLRYRNVSLGLWGDLNRAVQLFPSRCGLALRVDTNFATPDRFGEIRLALEVMNGPLLHLLDWMGRQTDTRYRRESSRAIWLTTPLNWAKDERIEAVAVLVDALYAKPDGSDLMQGLLPGFKDVMEARSGCMIVFEPARQEIQAILPYSACVRLKEICLALRAAEGQGLPPMEYPSPSELRLKKTLAEKTVTLKRSRRRLDFLLRDFAEVSGVAMAMDPRQWPAELPYVDVDIDNAPMRDAVRTIVDVGGFDGCSVEPPGGLWFYRGNRPYPSGELLWDHATVQAYDLSRLLTQLTPVSGEAMSGEMIAYAITKRIYPDSWKEPGAMIFYHAPTRKLLVMHGPAAQRRVLDFLYDLGERGAWALGPVEEAAK